ncbi:MAG: putative phytoene synthase (terpenoid synthase) [Rickettsiaceae bacterium]|jgi:phytoene synthase|nr:putative phytoene synthase (terpenoid synthase) [Rickettsiaceae bacterium]
MTLSFCALEVKKYDYYRYLCCLLAPENLQERFFAIYAFNNEIARIKEVVSEPMVGHIRLQWWRDAIEEIYKGVPVKHNHEIVRALYKLISQVDISKELFDNLIDAREADIEFSVPENIESLENYTIATSSGLFELLLTAAEIYDKSAVEASYHAGIAYALTGIMRAMKFNAHHGKVMFPASLMQNANITDLEIIEGKNLEKTYPITQLLCDKVKSNMKHTRLLLKNAPKSAINIFLPLAIVDSFIALICKNNYDIFNSDIEVPALKLQFKILKAKVFCKI